MVVRKMVIHLADRKKQTINFARKGGLIYMPRRGENIRKRTDGRWEGRYKTGTNSHGHTTYRSVYGKTYKEVKEKLRTAEAKSLKDSHTAFEKTTFQELLKRWMAAECTTLKESTCMRYEYLIEKHILPDLGGLKVDRIDTLALSTFMDKKLRSGRLNDRGGLSAAYVRSIMLIVDSALRFGINEGFCPPKTIRVYKPSVEKKEIQILNLDEQKKLEAVLYNNPDRTKLGILLSLGTGLRIGEVCALKWEDIDFSANVIHVRATVARIKNPDPKSTQKTVLIIDRPKTRASIRDIPIPSMLNPYLQNFKGQNVSDFVLSDTADFVSPRTYEYRYHRILEDCGIPPVNYHALRHTFATRCIEVGVDVKSLSEILGHANVSITLNTYVHSSMELKRAQIEKLAVLSA